MRNAALVFWFTVFGSSCSIAPAVLVDWVWDVSHVLAVVGLAWTLYVSARETRRIMVRGAE